MQIRRVEDPASEPLTVAEAKDHLNFDSSDKDALIAGYISAARGYVEGQCHIVIGETLFEQSEDGFPSSEIVLGRFPVISVQSVKYDDEDGDEQTLATSAYTVDVAGSFSKIVVADAWPATIDDINSVRIRFYAGVNVSGGDVVPRDLKQAMLLMVGFFFANRDGSNAINEPPPAVEALISHYRVPVIA